MPKVNFQREEVIALTPRWDLVRDVLSGEKAIKDKGETYLPKPNATDISPENTSRYNQYKTRAVFYGVTSRTLRGLSGQVFARDPVVALPNEMDLMVKDVDGAGVSLDQQARKALSHCLAFGRAGLLTDYPTTDKPQTKAELAEGYIRPTITLYEPWDVINWRVGVIGGKKVLTLVVISESEVVDDDGFEKKEDPFYRVLRLVDGVYHSQVWYFDETNNDFKMESDVTPTRADGKPWDEIPFTFIGVENNDTECDLPPLYDLAIINVAHYRNSADYEESCFIVGQPTPFLAGLTQAWVDENYKDKTVQLGSRAAVLLPENGTAGVIQAEANIMPKEAMDHKERQMVALGAKLVEQKTVQRTATEAGAEEASTTSLLATAAKNVAHAYTCALAWAAEFLGVENAEDEEGKAISYELNTDFDIMRLSAQDIAAVIAGWQANAFAFEEMRDYLKRGGVAYMDDEEAKAAMETAGPDLGMPVTAAKAAAEAEAAAAQNAALGAKAMTAGGSKMMKKPAGKKK